MNYNDIISLALGYSDQENTEVIDKMDMFMKVVESRINRYLATQDMAVWSYTTLVTDLHIYQLPEDWLSLRAIRISSILTPANGYTLNEINQPQMDMAINTNTGGPYYSIVSKSLYLASIPDPLLYNLEINYYQRIASLTSTNTENWVSLNNPDCYLFGLMVEINSFVKDAEATALWEQRFTGALAEIHEQDHRATWSGTPLFTQVG
jgi:hypothetical protein